MNTPKNTQVTLWILSQMPFLDSLELSDVGHLRGRTTREALRRLREDGCIEAVPYTRPEGSRQMRYCLTPIGVEMLAGLQRNGKTPDELISKSCGMAVLELCTMGPTDCGLLGSRGYSRRMNAVAAACTGLHRDAAELCLRVRQRAERVSVQGGFRQIVSHHLHGQHRRRCHLQVMAFSSVAMPSRNVMKPDSSRMP